MDEIQANIKKFGDQRNLQQLQEYIASIDIEELTSFITERISYRNIQLIWTYLLESLTDSDDSQEKRFKIATVVLKQCEESNISNAILNRLCLEFPKFKTSHLVEFCDFCVEKIQRGQSTDTSWKDLLPHILKILAESDLITYNNTEMSGLEFVKHVVNSLCMINWSTDILTPLTAMFCEISLTKEEHLQVVSKLGNCMEKLSCQEIPAITYQLLRFCSAQNSICVFLRLQSYFSQRIYQNIGSDLPPASDTTDFDEISDSHEHDALQVESTVLFHVHNVAKLGDGSINGYITSLKTMLKAPEFVLHPFQLTVLLTISTASIYEEPTLEIIRSCVVRVITEDFKKTDSYWFNEIVTVTTAIRRIFSDVIDNSIKERNLVISGLINLSFTLLGAGAALGSKNIAQAQWDLATFILLKLMKRKHEVSNTVLMQLCNRIITGQNVSHLTDCLHQMCRSVTLCVVENQSIIVRLTEEILVLPGLTSRYIIDSIIPLVKISQTIRDNLILLLRKALYRSKIETKQMAVSGYLKLLKNLRISNMAALSQGNSSSSSSSIATQLSLGRETLNASQKFSNEALCLEVLGVLRRSLMQQSEVRAELYEGLYEAICVNSELGIPVLNMLWGHFKQFYNDDEDAKPPILFDKIMITRGVEVILQEPIGQFIHGIGRIVTKVKESNDRTDPKISRFEIILDSFCNRMPQCELIHFNLDNGCDLLDTLPESQRGLLVLKQALSMYEALMGYLIGAWTTQSEDFAQKINALFVGYSRLVDHSKNLSKPKKAEARKKAKDKDETKSKSTPVIFKPIPTVLDFQTVCKILHLLHDPTVSWANSPQANILNVKPEFHRYVLNTIMQLIQTVKSAKCIETVNKKSFFKYFTDICTVLHERIFKRLSNVIDFDCTTAVLGIECFHAILSVIATHCKDKLCLFLSDIGSKGKEAIGDHLMPFIELLHEFFESDEHDYTDDPEGKKLPVLLVETYKILVLNLPLESPQMPIVLEWLKKYTDENAVPNKLVGQIFISLLLTIHVKCKSSSGLYENIAIRLGDVMGTVGADKPECPVQLKILNEGTVLPTLISLTNVLKTMLNEVDWIIPRFRAEYCMVIYPGGDKTERRKELLKDKERAICSHLCQIINVCSMVSNLSVPSGSNAELVFKILIHLFQTLNSMTKYFIHISSTINPAFESARFERVLKLSGKPLSNKVYDFILYVEEGHSQTDDSVTQIKKKTPDANTLKTKVLRETRLIPKLIYEMEQFGRCVITLSKKTKIDLSKYVGLGTSRDFRIKGPALQEALEKNRVTGPDDRLSDSDETILNDIPAQEEPSNSMAAMDICEEDSYDNDESVQEEESIIETSMQVDEEESDEGHEPPPLKRARKST